MRAAPVPGAVIGALHDYKLSWLVPLGVRTEGSHDPITAASLFQAASLTKQVTAYAAFALRAQGKLDFNRPLVSYVDDLPNPAARAVTVRHVLSQSSGFPNWRFSEDSKALPDLVPEFTPGSRYQYSGEGFFYLQRVLEQVSGTGFGQLIHDMVFQPLGMASSTLVWDPETLARTALPHQRHGEPREGWDKTARAIRAYAARIGKPVTQLRYEEYSAATRERGDPMLPNWMAPNGAASLVTSAEDYARFLAAAIRNPEIGRQQTAINDFLGWGLGWAIERASGHTYVWQWGEGATKTSCWRNLPPETRSLYSPTGMPESVSMTACSRMRPGTIIRRCSGWLRLLLSPRRICPFARGRETRPRPSRARTGYRPYPSRRFRRV